MNKWIGMGRLTRDPDIRYSNGQNGQMCIARYTLAIDRRRTGPDGQREADYISCVAFAAAGEFAEKYLRQGTRIVVTGRIQTGSYTNKEGQKVYTTDIIVEDQEFAESKAAQDRNSSSQNSNNSSKSTAGDGFMNIPDGYADEGLPFN